MTVYAYYTPHVASPVNDRRGGTIRLGSDDPQPIKINAGYANYLIFGFRDERQHVWKLMGRSVTAEIYNSRGVKMLEKELNILASDDGLAKLEMLSFETKLFEPGFYSLVLTFVNDQEKTEAVLTMRSMPRFVLDIIDFSAP